MLLTIVLLGVWSSILGNTNCYKKSIFESMIGTSELNLNKVCVVNTRKALKGHHSHVSAVAISKGPVPKIVSASWDFTLRVWDLLSESHILTYTLHTCRVYCLAISSNDIVVSAGSLPEIHIWALNNGQQLRLVRGHDGSIFALAVAYFSLPTTNLAVWSTTSATVLTGRSSNRGGSQLFMKDSSSSMVVSGGDDGLLCLWNIESGELIRQMVHPTDPGGVHWAVVSVAVSQGSRPFIVSGSACGTIAIWNISQGVVVYQLEGHFGPISGLAIYSAPTPAPLSSDSPTSISSEIQANSEYHKLYRSSHSTARYGIHNPEGGEEEEGRRRRRSLTGRPDDSDYVRDDETAWDTCCRQGILVSTSADWTIRVWSLVDGKCVRVLDGHSGGVECVSLFQSHTPLHRSGRHCSAKPLIVSGGRDATVRVWDLWSGQLYRTLEDHSDAVCGLAISSSNRPVLVSGGVDASLQLWDLDRILCDIAWERRKHYVVFVHCLRKVMYGVSTSAPSLNVVDGSPCGESNSRLSSKFIGRVFSTADLCYHIASYL
jgi:WD40 repeat protein